MIPRLLLATAEIPGGGGTLRLMRRGAAFSIMQGPVELMNSRLGGSEEALATLACDRLAGRAGSRVLIGGLGMGFTLRAALATLGGDAVATVVELVPAVVAWARGPMAHLHGESLDDPRVRIVEDDVGAVIARVAGGYDAILLDVDNGPGALSRAANDRLYDAGGLDAARRALRPGGLLAVWSSAPDKAFTRRLHAAGFAVEEVAARASRGGGARHHLWFAARPER